MFEKQQLLARGYRHHCNNSWLIILSCSTDLNVDWVKFNPSFGLILVTSKKSWNFYSEARFFSHYMNVVHWSRLARIVTIQLRSTWRGLLSFGAAEIISNEICSLLTRFRKELAQKTIWGSSTWCKLMFVCRLVLVESSATRVIINCDDVSSFHIRMRCFRCHFVLQIAVRELTLNGPRS